MMLGTNRFRSSVLGFFWLAIAAGFGLFAMLGPVRGAAEGEEGAEGGVDSDRSVSVEASARVDVSVMGAEIYGRCQACHAIGYDRVGPRHCGLFGRPAGSVPEFAYSEAMRRSGIVWGPETLDRFLADPMRVVPGTLMTYAGVPDPRDRAILIAWLKLSTVSEQCR